jgi:two-component system, NarL family, response regulator NreC
MQQLLSSKQCALSSNQQPLYAKQSTLLAKQSLFAYKECALFARQWLLTAKQWLSLARQWPLHTCKNLLPCRQKACCNTGHRHFKSTVLQGDILLLKVFHIPYYYAVLLFAYVINLEPSLTNSNCLYSITIIIADDHLLWRNGLSAALTTAGMQVVAMVGNGEELIAVCKQHLPDVAFIDIRMPGMDGIAACRELAALFPHMGKIAVTYHDPCHPDVYKMSQAGATGFLSKLSDHDEIIRCVHAVYHGGTYCDENCWPALKERFDKELDRHGLTEKQQQLLRLIGEEKTTDEIAAIMHQSPHTIEKWRMELNKKCEVKTVVGLIKFGVKWGIIEV